MKLWRGSWNRTSLNKTILSRVLKKKLTKQHSYIRIPQVYKCATAAGQLYLRDRKNSFRAKKGGYKKATGSSCDKWRELNGIFIDLR